VFNNGVLKKTKQRLLRYIYQSRIRKKLCNEILFRSVYQNTKVQAKTSVAVWFVVEEATSL